MPLEPNVSYPSSTDVPAFSSTVTRTTEVRGRAVVRLATAAWALAVYVIYWLGYLPGAR